jgi:Flp pilus assembly protein TadG
MAELAISFPILLLMLSGLLDLGRMYYIFVSLQDAAAEAALFLSVSPECQTSADGTDCADPNNALFRAQNAGGTTGVIDFATITTTITYEDDEPVPNGIRDIGDIVTVRMEYPFEFITPIMPKIASVNPITLTAISAQTVVQNPD